MAADRARDRPRVVRANNEYHDLKKTSLIYSTAVVISLLLHPSDGAASFLGVSVASADIVLLRGMLMTAASYYLMGFVLAFLVIRRDNSASELEAVAAREMFDVAAGNIWRAQGRIAMLLDKWAEPAEVFGTLDRAPTDTAQSVKKVIAGVMDDYRGRFLEPDKAAALIAPKLVEQLALERAERLKIARDLQSTIPVWVGISESMSAEFPQFVTKVKQFANVISWEQRITLYGWDLACVIALFVGAAVSVASPEWTVGILRNYMG